ncbi:hypothetical protein BM74_16480 [Bacillus thuringiensis]|uniref:Uncharacterized protein n=1 Tax=Bacillus thuringiensis TaxID=1428 RepID=A0A437SI82_BACTU|nr:hypothetical protein BM74_16480 [Bacillus thuringiensis]
MTFFYKSLDSRGVPTICTRISAISNRFHASQEEIRTSVVSFLEYIAQCPEKVLQRLGVEQLLKYIPKYKMDLYIIYKIYLLFFLKFPLIPD